MPEGYQPSPEELGLAQEILEANGISEQETDHGFQHLDAEGRVVLQTETWGETQQTIQLTYGEGDAVTEQGKLMTGPEAGKKLTREHPRTAVEFPVTISDADLGDISSSLSGRVETLAGSVGQTGELEERWANLEVNEPSFLEQLSALPPERRQTGDRGESYIILRGEFGGGFEFDVNGRTIVVESIKKLSISFDPAGKAIRANFGTIAWHEKKSE